MVFFANFTFTFQTLDDRTLSSLAGSNAPLRTFGDNVCVEIVASKANKEHRPMYFPEYNLSRWFYDTFGEEVPVYAFAHNTGVQNVSKAYKELVDFLDVDAVVLVDGGTDSLMRGDEEDLGTPTEDSTSMISVSLLDNTKVPNKMLVCLGMGVDCFHGVSHHLFLENVAELQKEGAFLGVLQLLPHMNECQLFKDAYSKCQPENSIVCSSIESAVNGEFGNFHHPATAHRTKGSQLYISSLMSQYWGFDLNGVVARLKYKEAVMETSSHNEVREKIERWRRDNGIVRMFKGYLGKRTTQPIPY
ncbi:hypothetical protein HK102_002273 [Quaeritorhiza haematococci]|nr:hypothetical protein HK102_002273 [Quaeritorhiza haematococci]